MPPERDPQSEIEKLERRYAEHPEGRMFAHLADAYRKAGELEQAERLILEGLERHPEYLSAHIVLGRVFFDEGRYPEAQERFKVVLEMDPENLIAIKALGDMALAEGSTDAARGWYERMLQVDPYNDEAQTALDSIEPAPGGARGAEGAGSLGETSGPESMTEGVAAAADDGDTQAPAIDRDVSGLQSSGGSTPTVEDAGGEASPAEPADAAGEAPPMDAEREPPPMDAEGEPPPVEASEESEPRAIPDVDRPDDAETEEAPDPDAVLENLEAIMDEAAGSAAHDEGEPDVTPGLEAESPDSPEPDMPSSYRSPDPDRWDDMVPEAEDAPEELPWERTLDFSGEEAAATGEPDASSAEGEPEAEDWASAPWGGGPPSDPAAEAGPAEAEDTEEQVGAGDRDRGIEAEDGSDGTPEGHAGAEGETAAEREPEGGSGEVAEESAADLDLDMEGMDEWSPGLIQDEYESTESFDTDELLGAAREADGEEGLMTETMADLYARQGLLQEALKIYRELVQVRPHDEQLRAKIRDLEGEIGESGGESEALDEELADELAGDRHVEDMMPPAGILDEAASGGDGVGEDWDPESETTSETQAGEGPEEIAGSIEPEPADRPDADIARDSEFEIVDTSAEASGESSWLEEVSPGSETADAHEPEADDFEFERAAPPADELADRDPFAASFEAGGAATPAEEAEEIAGEAEPQESVAWEDAGPEPAGFAFGSEDEPRSEQEREEPAEEPALEPEPEPESEPEPALREPSGEPVGVGAAADERPAGAAGAPEAASGESIRDYLRALVGFSATRAAEPRSSVQAGGSPEAERTEGTERTEASGSSPSEPDPDDGSEDLEQFQEWLRNLKR